MSNSESNSPKAIFFRILGGRAHPTYFINKINIYTIKVNMYKLYTRGLFLFVFMLPSGGEGVSHLASWVIGPLLVA